MNSPSAAGGESIEWIEHLIRMLQERPEINEFKHTSIPS
jgi:hypothetical protein